MSKEAKLVNDQLEFHINGETGAVYTNSGLKYGNKNIMTFDNDGNITFHNDVVDSTTFIKAEHTFINDRIFNIGSGSGESGAFEDRTEPFGISVGGVTGSTGAPAAELLYYPNDNKWQISSTGGSDATLTGILDGSHPSDAVNFSQLEQEIKLRTNDVESLDTRLSTDVNSLDTRLSNEESNRISDVKSLDTHLSTDVNSLDTRLSNEESNRISDVKSLDTHLSTDVNSLDTRLSNEESNRISDVKSLDTHLSTDVNSLDTRLSNEESNRISDVKSLDTHLSTDVNSLDTRLSSEESNRISDVASLHDSLSYETSALVSQTNVTESYVAIGDASTGLTGFSNFTWVNSGTTGLLGVTGTVKINGEVEATSVSCTSDKKLKTNIEDIVNSKLIHSLRSVQYNWIDQNQDQRIKYGFIAQEVEEILPDIVNHGVSHLSIDYIQLISHLVKEVQKLRVDVDELQSK